MTIHILWSKQNLYLTVNEEPQVHQCMCNDCYLNLSGFDNVQEGKEDTGYLTEQQKPDKKKVGHRTGTNCSRSGPPLVQLAAAAVCAQ